MSRLSSGLAAAAALVALFGPETQRSLARDVALLLGAGAFFLWRLALGLRRRRAHALDDAVPDARPLDAAALHDALALLETRIAHEPTFESALVAAADALRGDLGAARVRALLVQTNDTRTSTCELFGGERPLRAPPVALAQDGSALRRAVDEGRPALAWPDAAALPVVHGGRVVAAIDLKRFDIDLEDGARRLLLERAAAALAKRPDIVAAADLRAVRALLTGVRPALAPC